MNAKPGWTFVAALLLAPLDPDGVAPDEARDEPPPEPPEPPPPPEGAAASTLVRAEMGLPIEVVAVPAVSFVVDSVVPGRPERLDGNNDW